MKILVTGAAGFIGHAVVRRLVSEGHEIVGIDNINDYYDVRLKLSRLADCGIDAAAVKEGVMLTSTAQPRYRFMQMDLMDMERLDRLFATEQFTHVINLAGQAGVRYSIDNPLSYVRSNVEGFLGVLESCRHHQVRHLVYASSSSIYGMNPHESFSEDDCTDRPVSLYAATKKSDELMAHAYSKLFGIQTVGLRFFTVYGPWGRPDMAPMKFTKAILSGDTLQVYNHGDMLRDFTYIDDIINGMVLALKSSDPREIPFRIYNIGCSNPVRLLDFIHELERVIGRTAKMEMLPMQPGDVTRTYANITKINRELGYQPTVSLPEGLRRMYAWYREYYGQ